jgi:hypothetical protein
MSGYPWSGYMRNAFLLLVVILLCGAKGIGQADSSSLHGRYGEPTLERFAVTPQIELLVNFGTDRQACEVLIQPTKASILPAEREFGLMMDESVVSQILEELSPSFFRGKAGLKLLQQSGCNENVVEEFETITISRTFHRCDAAKVEQEVSAWVTFKRSACDSIVKARTKLVQDSQPVKQETTP